MKRCSTLLDIREIQLQIKTTIRNYFTPTRMAIINKIYNNNVTEDMEICVIPSQIAGAILENSLAFPQNVKQRYNRTY